MASNQFGKSPRSALWFAPLVIVPIAFFAALPWLKQMDGALVQWIAATTAILVMGYSVFLTRRVNRHLDEVEIASQRFATTQGWTFGLFAAGLVVAFPPAMNALVNLANSIAAGSPDKAVKLGIVIGFMMVIILQTLSVIAVAVWWQRRLGRPS